MHYQPYTPDTEDELPQCRNLVPNGWIEEVKTSLGAYCDAGTISIDSLLDKFGPIFLDTAKKMGKPLDAIDKCRFRIEAAGFINERV